MTPHQFLAEVVQPNMEDALRHPGDLRFACNAILCMDALMGLTYWHLEDLGDPRATKYRNAQQPDSDFRGDLIASSKCAELRGLRDASYTLKHGRLKSTRQKRVINSASQVAEAANSLGWFQVGDELNGQLVYWDTTTGARLAARDVIAGAYRFLKPYVDGLPQFPDLGPPAGNSDARTAERLADSRLRDG